MSEEAFHLYQINKTVVDMMHCRGYKVPKSTLDMSFEDWKQQPDRGDNPRRESLTQLFRKADESDCIMIFFDDSKESKVGVPQVQEYYKQMKAVDCRRALLIHREITPWAKQCVVKLKVSLELWKEQELLVNIMKHSYVPPHVVLTDDQKADLLKRYKLKETQLPRIQLDDPVARFLGLETGQVVKITRPSETAGRYVTYRFVV